MSDALAWLGGMASATGGSTASACGAVATGAGTSSEPGARPGEFGTEASRNEDSSAFSGALAGAAESMRGPLSAGRAWGAPVDGVEVMRLDAGGMVSALGVSVLSDLPGEPFSV